MVLKTASQGCSASAAAAYGMVCFHSSMVVSGQGPAMAPTAQMEPLYRSGQQEVHQHHWPEEGVWLPACVISSSGRTSRLGDPRSNPDGAGADRPFLLLSIREKSHQQHPTARDLRGQARQAAVRGCGPQGLISLEHRQSLPDRAHPYDRTIRQEQTEPPVGVYGWCDPCSYEDPG